MVKMRVALTVMLGALILAPLGADAADSTERRLERLEKALKDAQDEIDFLRGELRRQKADTETTKSKVDKGQEEQAKKIEEAKKSISLPDWVKRVSLFGDLRLRHEGFYNRPVEEGDVVHARNRERVRARVGLKAAFSDELSATVRLASGNPNDPISTNETLTNTFTPKNINLDWAYMTLTPGKTFNMRPGVLALTGGKFPNPVFRPAELLFDDDLSLEGFSETVAALDKPYGVIEQVRIHAIQATYAEVDGAQDGWMFGGQVNPSLKFGDTQVEIGAAHYGFLNANLIATALNTNSALANTNLLVGSRSDDTVTDYQSEFQVTNMSAAVTIPNVINTQPVRLFGDFIHNWDAATSDSNGYTIGARLGQTKVQGDWSVAGYWQRLEQEAAISAFTGSDFGLGGTNNQGPVLAIDYQLLNPLTLTARNYFINYIDRPAGTSNPTLFRLQLDAVVKF
jgi:hypothetical protein